MAPVKTGLALCAIYSLLITACSETVLKDVPTDANTELTDTKELSQQTLQPTTDSEVSGSAVSESLPQPAMVSTQTDTPQAVPPTADSLISDQSSTTDPSASPEIDATESGQSADTTDDLSGDTQNQTDLAQPAPTAGASSPVVAGSNSLVTDEASPEATVAVDSESTEPVVTMESLPDGPAVDTGADNSDEPTIVQSSTVPESATPGAESAIETDQDSASLAATMDVDTSTSEAPLPGPAGTSATEMETIVENSDNSTGNPESSIPARLTDSVDCQSKVPCQWRSEDEQFTLTVGNADNIASQGNLAIQFSVQPSHDSTVTIGRSGFAIDGDGVQMTAVKQTLGTGNGVTPQTVNGGGAINGQLDFNTTSDSTSLAEWSVNLIDNGVIRAAAFRNIPVGPSSQERIDCANVLPCVWVSSNKDVTITLLSAGALTAANRLTANLSIITSANTNVAIDAGSTAVASDGTQYTARTHQLGTDSSYEKLVSPTRAQALLAASIHFYKAPLTSPTLQDLSLVIYKDKPEPRWNPRFTAVPLL